MSLVDDALGQGMVIVAEGANLAVGEKEFLSFECVTAAHGAAIDGDEKFVVDAGLRRARQPARLGPAIEHHILVRARLPQAAVELRHRGFVLRTIRLDDDGHE